MSSGGTQNGSPTVGLPNNSTAPGYGGMGIGGGIYGNPFQVNQLSQPSGLSLQPMGLGQPMGQQQGLGGMFSQPPTQMGLLQQLAQQQQGQRVPLFQQFAQLQQGRGAMLNQPPAQMGLGSLIPGNYASQR